MTTSDNADSILARVAQRNDGETVSYQCLAEWLTSGGCRRAVMETAAWSILELATNDEDWANYEGLSGESGQEENAQSRKRKTKGKGPSNAHTDFPEGPLLPLEGPQTKAEVVLDAANERAIAKFTGTMFSPPDQFLDDESCSIVLAVSDMLALWNNLATDDRPRDGFPLEILYVAWRDRPKVVEPNTRHTGRIIPSKLAQVAPGDRQAGKLFAFAAHIAHATPESGATPNQMGFSGLIQPEVNKQQFVLPGFKESTTIGPCLPLALYDLGDAPATSRGPAAPLPLRLFVEAVLAVPMDSRDTDTPVAMRITLRQMLEWLYPSPRKPRPNEYWPRLMTAFEALESPEARIPWYDPETGHGGLRRIVNISDIPRGAAKLDDLISVIVDLPPGSGNGPQVSDNLRLWGIKSAAGYRALLNLAYRWFEPGRTHYPVGRGRRRYWAQTNDPDRYQSFTENELIALCFPTSGRSARRNLVSDARKVIRQLEQAGELRVLEARGSAMKILPPLTGMKAGA